MVTVKNPRPFSPLFFPFRKEHKVISCSETVPLRVIKYEDYCRRFFVPCLATQVVNVKGNANP